jgi:hypothetical protein
MFFNEFLRSSTIHGLRYLVDSRSLVSKVAWLFCIAASFLIAVYMILLNIEEWNNSPTTVRSVTSTQIKASLKLRFSNAQKKCVRAPISKDVFTSFVRV